MQRQGDKPSEACKIYMWYLGICNLSSLWGKHTYVDSVVSGCSLFHKRAFVPWRINTTTQGHEGSILLKYLLALQFHLKLGSTLLVSRECEPVWPHKGMEAACFPNAFKLFNFMRSSVLTCLFRMISLTGNFCSYGNWQETSRNLLHISTRVLNHLILLYEPPVARFFYLLVISVCIYQRLVRMTSSHNESAKLNFWNHSLLWISPIKIIVQWDNAIQWRVWHL